MIKGQKSFRLVIPGRLPGLNEYIDAERTNRYKAAAMKRDAEERIRWAIKSQLRGVKYNGHVSLWITWYEPNRKRDKDNIAFAKKFIQDALVQCRVLRNDGWDNVTTRDRDWKTDKKNPRVEVEIFPDEV